MRSDCTVTIDLNGCGGEVSGTSSDTCADPADCEAKIAAAKQTQPACSTYSYNCSGASGSDAGGGGTSSIQDATANALAHGMVSGNQMELGTGIMGLGVMAVMGGLSSSPPSAAQIQAQQEAAAAAEAKRQREAAAQDHNNQGIAFLNSKDYEQAISEFEAALRLTPDDPTMQANLAQAQQDLKFERDKEAAIEELKGGDAQAAASEDDDSLKGDDSVGAAAPAQAQAAPAAETGNDMGLKTDDASAQMAAPTPQATPERKFDPKNEAFQKGLQDALGCFSSSAGPYCMGAAPDKVDACVAHYNAGFQAGTKVQERRLRHAKALGYDDGIKGLDQGASRPDAEGPCRIEWIEAYNQGYFAGKHRNTP